MSPEFLRCYYVMRILTNPEVYSLPEDYVSLTQLQDKLKDIRAWNHEDNLYEKLESHSRKTIKRDLKKIESFYKIIIRHKRNYGCFLEDEEFKDSTSLKEIYEKTELYLLNHHAHAWKNYITSDRSSLSEHVDVAALINAIEHKFLVELKYIGWYDDNLFQTFTGIVQPLHLKEMNNAWYLMAHNSEKGIVSYCLDKRISGFNVLSKKAKSVIKFKEKEYFKHSIGILKTNIKPEWIHIKVANHHLKYLEANSMHPSQVIVASPKKPKTDVLNYNDPDIWGEIKICVEPNYEFLMEIYKYNIWVKVISPKHVKADVKKHLQEMMSYYDESVIGI